ncbi:hypothetical protein [Vibrio sp. EA2]|uniref:hypothetical protein n=1 Tax=Vibrio sp. EA2 TaxID=3079860 RepID=UPI00294A2EC3|nr:hypothetical protein [Vibrio sp. EA2]MDV6250913.1 hypothetical protein [Vibrio sp. EA2]
MTQQNERGNVALSPHFFQPYELSFEQLILWAKKFAELVPYMDENKQVKGNWSAMFEQNELVVCAAILSMDEAALKRQFKQAQCLDEDQTLEFILHLFTVLNSWYRHLPSTPEISYELKLRLLNRYQAQLNAPLQQLFNCTPKNLINKYEHLDPLWKLSDSSQSEKQAAQLTNIKEEAQHCLSKILVLIESLKQDCRDTFTQSLHHGEHPPQLALFLSFLKLFKRAQNKINQFTHKHLLFYYQDVLNQYPQSAEEAPVFLKLSQGKASKTPVIINKGQAFTPGNTATFEPIEFRTNYAMSVTNAEVKKAFGFTLRRDPLISPEKELGFNSGISRQKIELNPMQTGAQSDNTQAFKMFGSHQIDDDSLEKHLGLVISDPILSLAEGHRELTLQFQLQEVGNGIVYQRLSQLYIEHDQERSITQESSKLRDAFEAVVNEIVLLQVPVIGSWLYEIQSKALVDKVNDDRILQLADKEPTQQLRAVYRGVLLALLEEVASKPTQDLHAMEQKERFFRVLGQLVSRYALNHVEWLSNEDINKIKSLTEQLIDEHVLDESVNATVNLLLGYSRIQTFYQLFEEIFDVAISTEEGWQLVDCAQIIPIENDSDFTMGFGLHIRLEPGFPATKVPTPAIHNSKWNFTAPALKLCLKAQSNCFPYTIFRDFEFAQLLMECRVKGATQVQLFNQDGQTDPSRPFLPLGAQPKDGSYLVVASKEFAIKHLKQLSYHLDWSGLPQGSDGFRDHYNEYPFPYRNHSFKVVTEVLNNGRWDTTDDGPQSLFSPQDGALDRENILTFGNISNSYTPTTQTWPQTPYSPQSNIRNGLFKITLVTPMDAFGHDQYGLLLSKTLTANAKSKKQQSLPKAPYTPMLNRLSINYVARHKIGLGDMTTKTQCRMIHLHPFGEVEIYPRNEKHKFAYPRILAHYKEDSHLFIGLTASELSGYLNLYFLLGDKAKMLTPYPSTEYQWYYLVGEQWVELPAKHIIHDTTHRFLTSGIITLDIPDAINTEHNIMPSDLYWLRVSTNQGIDQYPKCYQIATHVIQVEGGRNAEPQTPPFAFWQCLNKPANLGAITQLTPIQQLKPDENFDHWVTRTSEHLRHKGKAITPWDYERLVLEQFPDIDAVNCFAAKQFDSNSHKPGHILLTVIPVHNDCNHTPCQQRYIDSTTLIAIRDYLSTIARAHTQIDVRNPGYETLQVRCSVTFTEGTHHGLALRQLEYAIMQTLCPWNSEGMNMGLGWQLSLSKLAAFIGKQKQVTSVSGLSVLKISHHSTSKYHLQDSARTEEPIGAELPWYLLVPSQHHFITIAPKHQQAAPVPAGVGDLVIGEEFIINTQPQSSHNGEETPVQHHKGTD